MRSRWKIVPAGVTALATLALIAALSGAPVPVRSAMAFPGDDGVIAFSSNMEDGTFEIYTVRPDGTDLRRVTRTNANYDPAWSGDGSRLVYTSYRDGPPVSPELYTMGPWGHETRVTDHDGTDWWPAWSPDSTRIAFTRWVGDYEIFAMDRDGTDLVNLTQASGTDGLAAWSPDGTRIAFTSTRDGDSEIYVMNADGTGQTRLSSDADHPVDDSSPAWSPDGLRIAFARDATGNDTNGDLDIWVMDADGTDATPLTDAAGNDTDPSWSPDGTRIVFTSTRDGGVNDEELYVMNADGTDQTRLLVSAGRDTYPDWQPVDTTDPVVALTTPADGTTYEQGEAATADFGCTDADTVVVACFGPVLDGARIDTTTTGAHTFSVTGVDRMHNSATVTHDYTVVRHQPDGRIRVGTAGALTPDDVYNTTATGQRRTARVGAGGTATFFVPVENDGTVTDTFRLRGGAATTRFAVRYVIAGTDGTAAITSGAYVTDPLAPGAETTVRLMVTAKAGTPRGAGISRLLRATSVARPAAVDAVKATVTRT